VLFICFLNWTDKGAIGIQDVAIRDQNLRREIQQLGGRLVGGYVTRCEYDVVLVLDMPDRDAMTKLTIGITSRGNARTTTVEAYSTNDFARLVAQVLGPPPH
jgi:uncharacterized protein with GYD domain